LKKPHADYQPKSAKPQTTTGALLTEKKREKATQKPPRNEHA